MKKHRIIHYEEVDSMDIDEVVEEDNIQLVSFIVASEKYGVDILSVREIIRVIEITPVPMSRKEIVGVINLRGNVIPVVDFRTLFSLEPIDVTNDTRIIVIEHEEVIIGLLVDAVSEVLTVYEHNFEPAPRNNNSDIPDFISTVIVLDDKESLLLVVDANSLFKHNEGIPEATE